MNSKSTNHVSAINNHFAIRLAAACLAVCLLYVLHPVKVWAWAWDPDDPWTLPDTGQTTLAKSNNEKLK